MRPKKQQPTDWQKRVRKRLRELARTNPDLTLHEPFEFNADHLDIDLTLNVSAIPRTEGGLPLGNHERFTLHIPPDPFTPPPVTVDHPRFLGYPHVLAGQWLCLYLDPSREWDSTQGITGHLNKLWQWLEEAAANKFDANTALYHAVGGFTQLDPDTPFIVVRHSPNNRPAQPGYLVPSTDTRRADHTPGQPLVPQHIACPIYVLREDLPFGPGRHKLSDLLDRLNYADTQQIPRALAPEPRRRLNYRFASTAACAIALKPTCPRVSRALPLWDPPLREKQVPPSTASGLLTVLAATAVRQPDGSALHIILAVPHPAGGPHHLLGIRFPAAVGDAFRRVMTRRTTTLINVATSDVADDINMEWCYVSDERPEVTTRRDNNRPVNTLQNRNIHIWGCGGLGSWLAEFAVRAGAASITICDPGAVTGGLLVRQNFTEANVGNWKADALAERLRTISDATTIHTHRGRLPIDFEKAAHEADLIIDATVNNTIGLLVDELAAIPERRATIAKVATDVQTGTLGIAIVSAPDNTESVTTIDIAAGKTVLNTPELEDYQTFWTEPATGDELTPTRGCSAPTFHGSAADMASIAGALITYISSSHAAQTTGTHLIALPQSGVSPAHRYLPSAWRVTPAMADSARQITDKARR